jgi:hypothetical protein
VVVFMTTDHGDKLVRHVMSSIMQQRSVHRRGCPNPNLDASRDWRLLSKFATMATGAEEAHLFPPHLRRPHHRRTTPPASQLPEACSGQRSPSLTRRKPAAPWIWAQRFGAPLHLQGRRPKTLKLQTVQGGQPPLPQSLQPARPPEERERGAGGRKVSLKAREREGKAVGESLHPRLWFLQAAHSFLRAAHSFDPSTRAHDFSIVRYVLIVHWYSTF